MALLSFTTSEGFTPGDYERIDGADLATPSDAAGKAVLVSTETPFAEIRAIAEHAACVIITFPSFADGRGFSLGVRLRKDFAFKGEIRAEGHVIPDQALFLLRAGFDSAEVSDQRVDAFRAALGRFQHFYQGCVRGVSQIPHLRHSDAA